MEALHLTTWTGRFLYVWGLTFARADICFNSRSGKTRIWNASSPRTRSLGSQHMAPKTRAKTLPPNNTTTALMRGTRQTLPTTSTPIGLTTQPLQFALQSLAICFEPRRCSQPSAFNFPSVPLFQNRSRKMPPANPRRPSQALLVHQPGPYAGRTSPQPHTTLTPNVLENFLTPISETACIFGTSKRRGREARAHQETM